MIHARNNIFLSDFVDGLGHHGNMPILYLSCQLLRSERLEVVLDEGEDQLDGVEVRAVGYIVNPAKV